MARPSGYYSDSPLRHIGPSGARISGIGLGGFEALAPRLLRRSLPAFDGVATYALSQYGRSISKAEGAVTTEYGRSAQRLMNEVKVGGATAANYEYDALGRRIRATDGQTTTVTLHSGNDIVYEIRKTRI